MLPNDPILNKVINKYHFEVFLIYFKLENKVRVYYYRGQNSLVVTF
jgi:hypothetical protein